MRVAGKYMGSMTRLLLVSFRQKLHGHLEAGNRLFSMSSQERVARVLRGPDAYRLPPLPPPFEPFFGAPFLPPLEPLEPFFPPP